MLKEVIIIQVTDSDGSVFQSIIDALGDRQVEVIKLPATTCDVLAFGDIEIFPAHWSVFRGGKEVHLNHGEFAMLLLMASSPGRVFSKDQLYNAAWNQKCYYGTTAVENIIWRLRQKLEEIPSPRFTLRRSFGADINLKCQSKIRRCRYRHRLILCLGHRLAHTNQRPFSIHR